MKVRNAGVIATVRLNYYFSHSYNPKAKYYIKGNDGILVYYIFIVTRNFRKVFTNIFNTTSFEVARTHEVTHWCSKNSVW